MNQEELIKKLAILGCKFIKEEGMSAKTLAEFTQACAYAFDISPEEGRELMGKIVHYTLKKEAA